MSDTPSAQPPRPQPNPDLAALERLVGTWQLSGDTDGTATYEWMEGGFFLLQHAHVTLYGQALMSMSVIGHLQPFGEAPGPDIRARSYDSMGNTLDYVYEIDRDTLTIWGGEKGSPAYFKGRFSEDGRTNTGEWVYPGGGHKSVMTWIK